MRGDAHASTTMSRARSTRLAGIVPAAAGFVPVWVLVAILLVVVLFVAPDTLSGASFGGMLPLGALLAVAALGQMLVIMTGGIDLSVPAVVAMAGTLTVGVSAGSDDRLLVAVVVALAWSLTVGLANGVLVGLLGLNPLIATLAIGQVVYGFTANYRSGMAQESAVPGALSSWASGRLLGMSVLFWTGVAMTLLVAAVLRWTGEGRRFQLFGANPRAAWIAGIDVRRFQVGAYAIAAVLYGTVGVLLAAFIRNPTLGAGAPYLLGPIAAVVIGGASLKGGVASATSTWVAAFGLTLLSQMLRVLGLPSALQFIVFGAAIATGMVVSGDRVVTVLSRIAAPSQTGIGPEPGAVGPDETPPSPGRPGPQHGEPCSPTKEEWYA
jgi:ribose transport system permease protein